MSSLASALSTVAPTLDGLLTTAEERRQQQTGDTQFYKPLTLIFELRLPGPTGPSEQSSYLFPLQLAPSAYSISEPFAVEVTPTQMGGLYVEEGGIVQRRIRLQGTTGVYPMPLPFTAPSQVPPAGSSFSRQLPAIGAQNVLSGQRHFQFLQDKVFRAYADHKRDPLTATQTRLYLHDVAGGEHWLVCPMAFGTSRVAQSPFESSYDIDLLVLDKAGPLPDLPSSKDRSLLAAMGDALKATQGFLRRANQAVNDLTAVQNQLSLAVHDVGSTFNLAASLIGAANNFVSGTSEFIKSPYQAIFAIAQGCENALRTAANLRDAGLTVANWPRPIEQRFMSLTTAAEQLGLAPSAFLPSAGALQTQQKVVATPTDAAPTVASFAAINARGSQTLPSEQVNAAAKSQQSVRFAGDGQTQSYVVQDGDSLSSLAVRFLGEAQAWSVIAAANNLSPPILPSQPASRRTDQFFGSLLQVGQTLRIPVPQITSVVATNAAVLGALPTQPPETQSLGVDVQTVTDAQGKRDWDLGSTDGMADIGTVEGEANFEQAMQARLLVEQGTAILYPSLGLPALVGTRQASADWQQVQLRVVQSLSDDPRVKDVRDVRLTAQDDGVTLGVTVQRVDAAGLSQLSLAI